MTVPASDKTRQTGATSDLSEKRVRRYAARYLGVAPRAVRLSATDEMDQPEYAMLAGGRMVYRVGR